MAEQLRISLGQHSDKGRKAANQDFHGARVPEEPLLSSKGICVGLADGISSSGVSQVASAAAVKAFLEDYYCTSEAWSVRTSAERVLSATNSWLYSQTRAGQFRYDRDKGYVCTFSGMVLKGGTAHLFHAGDARIYRLRGEQLDQLTEDHRLRISEDTTYLSRALGASAQLELDYRAVHIERGSVFVLATDGVYEHVSEPEMVSAIREHGADLDAAARAIVSAAYAHGSGDNLTVQILRVDELPSDSASELFQELLELPFPPVLQPRMLFEGYRITREIHASHRSHVYLASDEQSQAQVVIKVPSVDVQSDAAYVERFLMEEWIARRINSPHVLEPCAQTRPRRFVYLVTEYIEGQTLAQWMIDHPRPNIETVRELVEQIAKGLQAFHRQETLHQDLRPENILIAREGTAKIIDFGSARVAGIAEIQNRVQQPDILGTVQYTAPEYFLGEPGSLCSDIFSLGVICYQMLSGRLPYGARVPQARTLAAQRRLVYESVLEETREIPAWIDDTLARAVHPDPAKRYAELSEFMYDLRHPSKAFLNRARAPLLERNPTAFWRWLSFILSLVILFLLLRR
ncbi:MAG: bifunctional protein-serine/threonine kinase/phosphatase [Deltaproteobacteria bacterium]